jgi:hypothetical protein
VARGGLKPAVTTNASRKTPWFPVRDTSMPTVSSTHAWIANCSPMYVPKMTKVPCVPTRFALGSPSVSCKGTRIASCAFSK